MGKRGDENQVVYVDGDIPQLSLQLGQLLVDSSQVSPGTTNLQQCTSQNPLVYEPLQGGYPLNAYEVATGVAPANYLVPWYVRGRYATFADWLLVCNLADAEGFLDADYAILADTTLPKKCDFRGFQITGAFYTDHLRYNYGWVKSWRAEQPRISGCFSCDYTGINTNGGASQTLTVRGGTAFGVVPSVLNPGTFWCKIGITSVTSLVISADYFDVNQNLFTGGIARYVHLTGGTGGGGIHANTFKNIDASDNSLANFGFLQDDTLRYVNYIENVYYENGSDIRGNFHIVGFQGDANSPPRTDRFTHILNAVGINSQCSKDFPSFTVNNTAVGGSWDILDSSGKPPCISHSGGASVSVIADTATPTAAGYRYQADFADAFDQFIVTLQPCGCDRFGLWVFYNSSADFEAITSNDGSGEQSVNVRQIVVSGDYKMLRIAGTASLTTTTVVTLYAYGAVGGATKTMSLIGVFGGGERAVIPPQRPVTRYRYGSATYNPPSLADGAGDTTTVSVTNAALGDLAQASFSLDLQGITVTAWVSAANTVSVRFQNESGGLLDLGSGTLRVQTQTPYA